VIFADELGPLRPAADKGILKTANSPIDVSVNGIAANVYAGEYAPNSEASPVNFIPPSETQPGMANVQLSEAWIPGASGQIQVQRQGRRGVLLEHPPSRLPPAPKAFRRPSE
jgi:uncharacterized protein (TIGR03437 family)